MSELSMYPVAARNVDAVWPLIAHRIRRVEQSTAGVITAEWVREEAEAGRLHMLVAGEGRRVDVVIGTTIDWDDGIVTLRIPFIDGDNRKAWFPEQYRNLEALAREKGIERIYLAVRKGWAKLLRGEGFRNTGPADDGRHTIMVKDLD